MSLFGDLMNAVEGAAEGNPGDPAAAASNPSAAGGIGGMGGLGAALGHPDLVNAVLGMLGNQPGQAGQPGGGGLGGLVQAFEQQGLGHLVASWVGNGQNLPVSPQQIESALGSDRLSALAQQAGIPPQMVSTALTSILPTLVNHLTPNGSIENGLLEEGLNLLRAKMA
jgi:uncharacterized protein YidB (DUF937 family)